MNLNIKSSYWSLQETLISIQEIPERLNRIDLVTKMELLEHIKIRKTEHLKNINEFLIFNPGYTFEFCANNFSQLFTVNELRNLENLINQSIEVKVKKDKYESYFNDNGLRFFDYLNESFNRETAPTTKYTIIWHFLNDKFIITCDAKQYLAFVKEYCKLTIKFSRLAFDDRVTDEKYLKHIQYLTQLYKEFKYSN